MSIKSVLENYRRLRKYHGAAAAAQVLLVTFLRRFMYFERAYILAFDDPPPGMEFPPPERARIATQEDLDWLTSHPDYELEFSKEKISQLLADGNLCLLNLVDGKIAGYNWMDPRMATIPRLGIRMELRPEEGYIYKGFTHPSFRGKALGNDRYMFWLRYLRAQNRTTVICDFSFDNKATLTRVGKLGLKKIGTGTCIHIGRFQKLFRTGDFANRRVTPL